MGGIFGGLLRGRTKMGLLRGGVLLILFGVIVGCGGTPQQDTGKKPILTPTPLPTQPVTVTPQPTPASQGMSLRSKPLEVPESEMRKVFNVDTNWRPLTFIKHQFEGEGDVVVDHAAGLIWQKSGSDAPITYEQAHAYISQLNQAQFAGYTDWRLPTMAELLSLVEPTAQSNGLYLNLLFDVKQEYCWSADMFPASEARASGAAWVVNFRIGRINWIGLTDNYVRAVRP
jgi:hypothetical protein